MFGNESSLIIQHPYEVRQEIESLERVTDLKEKFTQSHARIGQGKYREKLLKQCPICPITLVSDDRLLIASKVVCKKSKVVFNIVSVR
jgi:hypothetical protein